jgi:hypothetical protein
MFKLKSLLVIGVSALIAGTAVSFFSDLGSGVLGSTAGAAVRSPVAVTSVDRTRKSDRLTVAQQTRNETRAISAVEVVGISNTAIIYRDRDGRVLYKSDPLNNATLVTKGVVLPEVTVRETAGSAVKPVTTTVPVKTKPVDSAERRAPTGNAPQNGERRTRVPEGCDAAASPIAAPQLSHILSKCLVAAPTAVKVASLY